MNCKIINSHSAQKEREKKAKYEEHIKQEQEYR